VKALQRLSAGLNSQRLFPQASRSPVFHEELPVSACEEIISNLFRDQSKQKTCSNCGVSFTCGPTSGERGCWCEVLPHVSLVAGADQDCLCPSCLSEAIAKLALTKNEATQASPSGNIATNSPPVLVEGQDYYCEGPAIVFTAHYLLRRGYCCDSGCRHCPYKTAPVNQQVVTGQ
jgi:hypothetical protein